MKYDEGMINFITNMSLLILPEQVEGSVVIRRPVPSTNQAIPSCFYILQNFMNINGTMLFLFYLSPGVSAGPQKPQTSTASKTKYEK